MYCSNKPPSSWRRSDDERYCSTEGTTTSQKSSRILQDDWKSLSRTPRFSQLECIRVHYSLLGGAIIKVNAFAFHQCGFWFCCWYCCAPPSVPPLLSFFFGVA